MGPGQSLPTKPHPVVEYWGKKLSISLYERGVTNTVDLRDDDLGLLRWDQQMGVDFALEWYQRGDVLYFSEGPECEPFDRRRLWRMYQYLNCHGRLYIIHLYAHGRWQAVGDVTLARDMLPIVLGEECYRGKGLGFRTLSLLIHYAKNELRWPRLIAHQIYTYNSASLGLFNKAGFVVTASGLDKQGIPYVRMERLLYPDQ